MPGIFLPFSDDKGVLLLSTVVKSGAQTSSLRLWRLQCVDGNKKDKGTTCFLKKCPKTRVLFELASKTLLLWTKP